MRGKAAAIFLLAMALARGARAQTAASQLAAAAAADGGALSGGLEALHDAAAAMDGSAPPAGAVSGRFGGAPSLLSLPPVKHRLNSSLAAPTEDEPGDNYRGPFIAESQAGLLIGGAGVTLSIIGLLRIAGSGLVIGPILGGTGVLLLGVGLAWLGAWMFADGLPRSPVR